MTSARIFVGVVSAMVLSSLGCGGEKAPPAPEPAEPIAAQPPAATSPAPASGADASLWSCDSAAVAASPSARVAKVDLSLVDPGGVSPIAGASVRACASAAEPACAEPLAIAETAKDGRARLDLPTGSRGFAGYFETARPGELLNVAFVSPPIAKDTADYSRPYWSRDDLRAFAQMAGLALDPEAGHVLARTFDCRAREDANAPMAAGVTVSLDPMPPGAKVAYTVHDGPGVTLSTAAKASDSSGHVAFFDVPAGRYTLVGRLASGAIVARAPIHVRAGALATIALVPGT